MLSALSVVAALVLPLEAPTPTFRVHPFTDLHFEVRAVAAAENPALPEGWGAAVDKARALNRALGTGWGIVEGYLSGVENVIELSEAWQELPIDYVPRFGRKGSETVHLRRVALDYGHELGLLEEAWKEGPGVARVQALQETGEQLQGTFEAHGAQLYGELMVALEMSLEVSVLEVLLVTRAPAPGAFTHRAPGNRGLSIVSTEGFDPATLVEITLHETLHQLDLHAGDASLLARLRLALLDAGASERVRDVPHTVFFLLAGELVKEHVDGEHVPYGDAHGYYAKVPEAVRILRGPWGRYRSGERDAEEFVREVVRGATRD